MMSRPRVLVIAPIRPARSGNGLAMRVSLFIEAAEGFADVDIVIVPVAGTCSAPMPPLRETTRLHEAPARPNIALSLISRMSADEGLNAFRVYGQPSMSGYLSREAYDLVARLTSTVSFGLILVMRSYMTPLAAEIEDKAMLVLDLDEDDFGAAASQARVAAARDHNTRAARLMMEAVAADRLIAHHAVRFRKLFISCESDASSLRKRHPGLRTEIVHNAVAIPRSPKRRHDGRTILFVGAFGHIANVDGIEWFAERVAPRIRACTSRDPRLVIAGSDPPSRVQRLARRPNVEVLGRFQDAAPLYARATIAVAPMRFGGGARTKIIEAAAHGVACVTHNESVNEQLVGAGWRAGNALDFASACTEALDDTSRRRKHEVLCRRTAVNVYNRSAVISELSRRLALLMASR